MPDLSRMKCVAISSSDSPLEDARVQELLPQVSQWCVVERQGEKQLERAFSFPDFAKALEFTDQIGQAAEEEDHHPRLVTEWGKVTVDWWTHKIKGLHQNDFIMAAKTDEIYEKK